MKFTRSISLLLALSLFPLIHLKAQENTAADSLAALLETTEGREHIEILFSLTDDQSLPMDDRLDYAEDAIDYARGMDDLELRVEALIKHGLILYVADDNEAALKSFNTAYEISEAGDYPDGMANALNRIGGVYIYMGETETAINYFNQARDIASRSRNKKVEATSLYYIAEVNRRNADYPTALEYYNLARPLAEESGDLDLLPDIIGNTGLVMYLQGDFQGAIRNYEEAAELYNQADSKFDAARMYLRIGNANLERAEYDVALSYLQRALPIFEEVNSAAGIAAVTNSMGVIYFTQELYDKALEVHFNQLERSRELGAQREIAGSLNNIGNVYNHLAADSLRSLFGENFLDSIKIEPTDKYLRLFDEALRYYDESLQVREELGDADGAVGCLMNMGIIYVNSGKPAQALEPLERALELNAELNNRANQAQIYLWLGQVYLAFDNYNTSLEYMNQSLDLALETDIKEVVKYIYYKMSEVYEKQNDYPQALKYYKMYFATNDSLTQEDRRKAIADMQVKYETEATEKENALLMAQSELQEAKISRTRTILVITIIAIGIFIVMMLQLIRQNNLKKKANRELAQKNALITEQKKEITDSIEYASRIQSAMLPPGDYVDSLMPERFILYMPRDIVSGDYYYITEKEGKVICVAADCTGHGVPGAFMSMLGIAFLNEIISKHGELHTDYILEELRNHVITSLHQTGKEGESQDGMDLAVYILDPKTREIEFSGANNSLLVYRNGELIEAKADKMPIGIHTRYKEPFTRHNLELKKGDMVYTFSDGYPDQFGGPKHKKFMIKNFKNMLQEIHEKPMEEQKRVMVQTLKDWMAETDQVDDILVIGVRI